MSNKRKMQAVNKPVCRLHRHLCECGPRKRLLHRIRNESDRLNREGMDKNESATNEGISSIRENRKNALNWRRSAFIIRESTYRTAR
jgi:hypothetical protein